MQLSYLYDRRRYSEMIKEMIKFLGQIENHDIDEMSLYVLKAAEIWREITQHEINPEI